MRVRLRMGVRTTGDWKVPRTRRLESLRYSLLRLPRQLLLRAILEDLVGQDADEHDRAHDGEIERAVNAEKVHQVLQHLEQGGADDDADDRTFAATQAAAAKNSR